ncbi:putative hydroperoxide dehydratase [Rosa chinensis]|uniref:Putative hydroperoxide dehydratase n=1 Tax=Rosa chinensis TaxID=74649 RepID=A0A2P6PN84_ROSCH|nr:allene oxide synthase [Rosa chinensis]PRQ23403.1 putative hydroperoxide dehydratase [Rosa chinensis]
MSSQKEDRKPEPELPLREIPRDDGVPFLGPIKDRLDYFYNQGRDNFFISRILKHQSTVFRTNMPPGPLIASNPNVVVLLDAKSFPVLLDTSKVEKRDVFTGTYMSSTAFTGGYRICSYLDPSEPDHAALKYWFLSQLSARKDRVIPLFRNHLSDHFLKLEDQLFKNGEADFNKLNDQMSFNFIFELFCDRPPSDTTLRTKGPIFVSLWLLPQLSPQITLGLPKFLNFVEDLLLHTVPFPALLVKPFYNKLYNVFWDSATSALDEAERLGIPRDEACHNLVFLVCFNAYGGMKLLFPALLKWVGIAGQYLHRQLRNEIRTAVKEAGGKVTLSALEKMNLTKSVVYEALRIEPPVPFQYGKAKRDMIVRSHDAAFEIKEGDMLFGYQTIAERDPKIFENPNEFVGDRFVEEGEKLLEYVWWSNGPETKSPTVEDKQCAGKDLVVLMNRILLVEFFLRYDTFIVDVGISLLGPKVTFKTLIENASYID